MLCSTVQRSAFLCSKPECLPGTRLGTCSCPEVTFERAEKKHWDSTEQRIFSCNIFPFFQIHPDCHSVMLTSTKDTSLSKREARCLEVHRWKWMAFVQERQEPSLWRHKDAAVLTLSCCHLGALLALPNFLPIFHTPAMSCCKTIWFSLSLRLNFLSAISLSLLLFQAPSFTHTN